MPNEENTQPTPEPTQPQPSPEAPAGNAEPISTPPVENPTPNQSSQSSDDTGQVSEPNPAPVSPAEPVPDASTPPTESTSIEVPPETPQAFPNPESAILDKDQNPANEPLEPAPTPENTPAPENPNVAIEKHGNDVTITEIMKPEPEPKTETAQMAGNEPLGLENDQAKIRKENLTKANEKRQSKKREKTDEILTLFSEKKEITNDEVEKLLHVSDATVTRYLETLEKEGKIKQVGKTGKGVVYEKI